MSESGLSLAYNDLRAEVGNFLGLGPDVSDWESSADDVTQVDRIIQAGYRQFLYPPPVAGQRAHDWSFLKPVRSLVTVADQHRYDLPDDFGSIDGDLTWSSSDNGYVAIPVIGEGQLRLLRQGQTVTTGKPRYAAMRPKEYAPGQPQRFELLLWPTPDADGYTLSYRYRAHPAKLSEANPYPLGGMRHSETILESCLAIAEQRLDDIAGVHTGRWLERLAASIDVDRQNAAEFLGYNADRSDAWSRGALRRDGVDDRVASGVTYNHVSY